MVRYLLYIHFSCKKTKVCEKDAIVVTNFAQFVDLVLQYRDSELDDVALFKVNIDGGKGSLKVDMNILLTPDMDVADKADEGKSVFLSL